MNRLYTIKVGSQEIRGLVSPGELPNLRSDFDWLSEYYGASSEFNDGRMIARKDDVEISLTVGPQHQALPGKRVLEALVKVMDSKFGS